MNRACYHRMFETIAVEFGVIYLKIYDKTVLLIV